MKTITVNSTRLYDEINREFIYVKEQTLKLEHSLVAISKWESKWNKPFLSKKEMTEEETLDYIKCMTITQNVDPNTYYALTMSQRNNIMEYINAPMSATTFYEEKQEGAAPKKETITSELIYYWMVSYNIPFSCEKWHLARLMNLIRICNIKNAPPKKMSKRDILNRNRALNRARRPRKR